MKNQLIFIEIAISLITHSLLCQYNNAYIQNDRLSEYGGCFKSSNIVQRSFIYVTISDSFSDMKAVGLIIVDNPLIIVLLMRNYQKKA